MSMVLGPAFYGYKLPVEPVQEYPNYTTYNTCSSEYNELFLSIKKALSSFAETPVPNMALDGFA